MVLNDAEDVCLDNAKACLCLLSGVGAVNPAYIPGPDINTVLESRGARLAVMLEESSLCSTLLMKGEGGIYERVIDPPQMELTPGSGVWLGQHSHKHGLFKIHDNTQSHSVKTAIAMPSARIKSGCGQRHILIASSHTTKTLTSDEQCENCSNFYTWSPDGGVIQDVKLIFTPNGYITQCPNLNRTCPTCSDFLSLVQGIMDLQELLAKMTLKLISLCLSHESSLESPSVLSHNRGFEVHVSAVEMFAITAELNYAESRLTQLEGCHCERTCNANGLVYRDKELWVEPENCRNCACKNGVVECRRIFCPPANCSEDSLPVHVDGTCCKKCRPKCTYMGQTFSEGKRFLSRSCRECKNGLMVRVTENCPELNCTVSEQILPDGRCCNVCRVARLTFFFGLASTCLFSPMQEVNTASLRDADSDCTSCKNFISLPPFHVVMTSAQRDSFVEKTLSVKTGILKRSVNARVAMPPSTGILLTVKGSNDKEQMSNRGCSASELFMVERRGGVELWLAVGGGRKEEDRREVNRDDEREDRVGKYCKPSPVCGAESLRVATLKANTALISSKLKLQQKSECGSKKMAGKRLQLTDGCIKKVSVNKEQLAEFCFDLHMMNVLQ
ncbi:Protein kinase C-binding protein NELL1 NEL-like protein 1 [Collichthys lucidus]|uniref:Protein kinase C-binding protein NELL1 NEL-like protein 1 n=1 Tax=Collichthys lucidus TaxID=240159 RepID=A0A4U5U8Z2_COLLU|nr:Protein kinase C-binding protein NELL1 NEL-like protein 1 [Collichthys lucidus]